MAGCGNYMCACDGSCFKLGEYDWRENNLPDPYVQVRPWIIPLTPGPLTPNPWPKNIMDYDEDQLKQNVKSINEKLKKLSVKTPVGATKEFVKHDDGKLRFSLIPPESLEGLMRVLEYGAKKYPSADNWKQCDDTLRYYNAAIRHLLAWSKGEALDTESNLPHLSHALACIAFLYALDVGKDK